MSKKSNPAAKSNAMPKIKSKLPQSQSSVQATENAVWTRLVQPETSVHAQNGAPGFTSLASSVERASTVVFSDVDSMRKRDWRDKRQYTYGLLGTPTTRRLERKLALVEGGEHCLLLPSGLAAISLILMALLKSGDRVLMPVNAYEPGREMARFMAASYGIEVAFYEPSKPSGIEMTSNTKLLWVETPGSVTMEVADLPALAAVAHKHHALLAIDATWSAGIALPVFELGADISIQALTKYQSGGSDVMMGSIVTRDAAINERLLDVHVKMGMGVSPEDCNIVLRSLPHYKLRYQAQDASARAIAEWLSHHPLIARVLHPALPDAPGHAIWRRDFTGAASLFSVVFKADITQSQIDLFLQALQLFHLGYSWGGVVSLVVPYELNHMRAGYAYEGRLVRFYIGLEEQQDLLDDLTQALSLLQRSLPE